MPLQDQKYKYNQTILKVYGQGNNKKIKVITMRCLRTAGLDCENDFITARGTANDMKLDNNISRARNRIFELAFCNEWQFFFTGTLNPKLYDRTDLEKFHKDLTKWLSNQSTKFGTKIKYLLIPELHCDGKSWHIHGFMSGIPSSELKQFQIGDTMSAALVEKVSKGDTVYNWLSYQNKFGFCDLEPIKNAEAVSKYITKYINKNLATSITELNAHLFYHSRGLNEAQTIKKGTMLADIEPSFTNDYCSVSWLDYDAELLENLKHSIVSIRHYSK